MEIAVVCAAGRQGSLLVEEALSRGHTVSAFIRKEEERRKVDPRAKVVVKHLMDLTYEDLGKFDAVIDAFGAWSAETIPLHSATLAHLCDILSGRKNRLLVVGGAGSLYVDPERKARLVDTPAFPGEYKPLAAAQAKTYDEILKRSDVRWTFLSPSASFVPDGKRTGTYQVGTDFLLANAAGDSEISYADYAIAMIDEVENGKFLQKRFTVCSK